MPPPPELDRLAAERRTVLKQEAATSVEVLGTGDAAVVRKVYRNLGHRWLQSFARRSRAEREFDNLLAVARAGVRCTDALTWSCRRRFGCVDESTLVTRFLPDSRPLKAVLAGLDRRGSARIRRDLAVAMGRLLGRLHRSGFLWCTPMPRNVLVLGDPARADLAVCDTPAGVQFGNSLHGTELACIDLFDAAFSPSRRLDFSAPERLRWLRAYTDGDLQLTRRLWQTLQKRSVLGHDVRRALALALHLYILLPLRQGRTRPPTPAP